MCLILLSWQTDPNYPLIIAANRDEFFQRPTLSADFWPEHPDILAGRDLDFGGSWLGVSRNGRFAAVTNLREVASSGDRSRGNLVKDFLLSSQTSRQFAHQLESQKTEFRPFNFIASDGDTLFYTNNIQTGWQVLNSGNYAIGNIPLSDQNAKTKKGGADLNSAVAKRVSHEALLDMLRDETPTIDTGNEINRALSCRFISLEGYGTRSSSIVRANKNKQWDFWEKHYASSESQQEALQHFSFIVHSDA
jgi:uncharacterized protein with NRDE domain